MRGLYVRWLSYAQCKSCFSRFRQEVLRAARLERAFARRVDVAIAQRSQTGGRREGGETACHVKGG